MLSFHVRVAFELKHFNHLVSLEQIKTLKTLIYQIIVNNFF